MFDAQYRPGRIRRNDLILRSGSVGGARIDRCHELHSELSACFRIFFFPDGDRVPTRRCSLRSAVGVSLRSITGAVASACLSSASECLKNSVGFGGSGTTMDATSISRPRLSNAALFFAISLCCDLTSFIIDVNLSPSGGGRGACDGRASSSLPERASAPWALDAAFPTVSETVDAPATTASSGFDITLEKACIHFSSPGKFHSINDDDGRR